MRLLALFVAATLACACGQKGPLVLPDKQHPHKKLRLPTPPRSTAPSAPAPVPKAAPAVPVPPVERTAPPERMPPDEPSPSPQSSIEPSPDLATPSTAPQL